FALAAVPLLVAAALSPAAQPPEKAPKPTGAAFAAIPGNAFAVVSLDVAKLWDHRAFEPVREARGKLEFAWMMESLIGLTAADLDRVTMFWAPPAAGSKEPSGPYLLVSARKPIDTKKVAALTGRKGVPALP